MRHNVKPVHSWVEVPDVPFEDGPSLPKTQPGQPSWPTATKRWWKAISRMPHCILGHASDWEFGLGSALVAAEFHRGDVKAATELRRREAVMGVTLDARRDLRIRYTSGAGQEPAEGVVDIDSYRESLR